MLMSQERHFWGFHNFVPGNLHINRKKHRILPIVSFLTRGRSSSCRPPDLSSSRQMSLTSVCVGTSGLLAQTVTGIVYGVGFTTLRWMRCLDSSLLSVRKGCLFGQHLRICCFGLGSCCAATTTTMTTTAARTTTTPLACKLTSLIINLMTKLWE